MHCVHRKRRNNRTGVSAALCVLKRQRSSITWKFLWHGAFPAAAELIPVPHEQLLTKGHIKEQLRTGEAETKVNIHSLLPQCDWLLRKHWSLVQRWEKAGWIHGRGNPLRATKYTENESGSGCVWAANGCKVPGGAGRCCLRLSGLMLLLSTSAFGRRH